MENLFKERRFVFREVPNTKEGGLGGGNILANKLEAIKFDEGSCRESLVAELIKALGHTNDKGPYSLTKVIWKLTGKMPSFEDVTDEDIRRSVDSKWSPKYLENAFENAKRYMRGMQGGEVFKGEPTFEEVVKYMLKVEDMYVKTENKKYNERYSELAKQAMRDMEVKMSKELVPDFGYLDERAKGDLLAKSFQVEMEIASLMDELQQYKGFEAKYLRQLKTPAEQLAMLAEKFGGETAKISKVDAEQFKADIENAKRIVDMVDGEIRQVVLTRPADLNLGKNEKKEREGEMLLDTQYVGDQPRRAADRRELNMEPIVEKTNEIAEDLRKKLNNNLTVWLVHWEITDADVVHGGREINPAVVNLTDASNGQKVSVYVDSREKGKLFRVGDWKDKKFFEAADEVVAYFNSLENE